eukprot:UN31868
MQLVQKIMIERFNENFRYPIIILHCIVSCLLIIYYFDISLLNARKVFGWESSSFKNGYNAHEINQLGRARRKADEYQDIIVDELDTDEYQDTIVSDEYEDILYNNCNEKWETMGELREGSQSKVYMVKLGNYEAVKKVFIK